LNIKTYVCTCAADAGQRTFIDVNGMASGVPYSGDRTSEVGLSVHTARRGKTALNAAGSIARAVPGHGVLRRDVLPADQRRPAAKTPVI